LADTEVLVFPDDESIGFLNTRALAADDSSEWEEYGSARGRVAIPDGQVVRLTIGPSPVSAELVRDVARQQIPAIVVWDQQVDAHLEALSHSAGLEDVEFDGCIVPPDKRLDTSGIVRLKRLALKNIESPDLLGRLVLPEGLRHLVLNGLALTDEALQDLSYVSTLSAIDLGLNSLTGSGLIHLALNRGLTKLSLAANPLTDNDLEALRQFSLLEELGLSATGVTEGKIAALSVLPMLSVLDVSYTNVDDDGALAISHLVNLRRLDLTGSRITNIGLEYIASLADLTSLQLASTAISGEALRHITALRNLRALDLASCAIGDGDLVGIQALHSLACLNIRGTKTTNLASGYLDVAKIECLDFQAH
jgi:hypothetical protein